MNSNKLLWLIIGTFLLLCTSQFASIAGTFATRVKKPVNGTVMWSYECPNNTFMCTDELIYLCYDNKYLCDGTIHCLYNGIDEKETTCDHINSRSEQQNNKGCLLPSKSTIRNFTVHCPYTADQCSYQAGQKVPHFTQITVECSEGYQFHKGKTSTSRCFKGIWKPAVPICYSQNRNNKACPRPNNSRCSKDKFQCSNGTCIDKTLICNGFSDCLDGHDERNETCQSTKCSEDKFRCPSGACIDMKYKCDGIKHCVFDANDEIRATCKGTSCLAAKYRCLTGSCLDRKYVCDGFPDCLDGDDEFHNSCNTSVSVPKTCSENQFQCSRNVCIDKKFVCDGVKHCILGGEDDEAPELCKNSTTSRTKQQNTEGCLLPSASTHQTYTVYCLNTADQCSHQAGKQVPHSTQIVVECSAGFQFIEGSTSILSSCFQGTWRSPIPKCYKTCPPIKDPDLDLTCFQKLKGASIPCDMAFPEGSIVQPKCKNYYHQDREVDYTYMRCQSNGLWDQVLFKCIADCGKAQGNTQFLINNGTKEKIVDSPWHVAIYDVSNPNEPSLICGGTIVTLQMIVSAAHCFWDFVRGTMYRPSMYEVVVAKYTRDYKKQDHNDLTKVYKIRKIFTPEIMIFTGPNTDYVGDIALLWTSEKIAFNKVVLPACVEWTYTSRFIVPDGTKGKLVGWGLTENETASPVLLSASLPYVNYGNCRQMVSEDFTIGADKFCAGTRKGPGARPGDSGGGWLLRKINTQGNLYYLRGIVSNKDVTIGEKKTSLAAFTDLAQYASWIYEKRIEMENSDN